MFNKIPKKLAQTCCLLKGLDPKGLWSLIVKLIYLYREFSITASIEAVVKEYIVSFHYKDNQLLTFKTTTLKDINEVIENIEISRTGGQDK